MQVTDLGHQRFIDRQAPGRVHQQHIEVVALGVVQRGQRDVVRLLLARGRKPLGAGLPGDRLQLLDRRRAIDVRRDRQHLLLPALDEMLGQLGGGGGLAGALQASHQDDGRRLGCEVQVGDAFAHRRGEFPVDDTDQRLAGVQRADDFLAERFLLDACDEVTHHRQRDIRLQQGHAHLAQHVLHIGFGDAGLAAHRLDEARQAIGKRGGHRQGGGCGAAINPEGRESTLS